MILKLEKEGRIHGIKPGRSSSAITHLMFADDILLFCRVNPHLTSVSSQIPSQFTEQGLIHVFESSNTKTSSSFRPTNSRPRDWKKAITSVLVVPNTVACHFLNIMTPGGKKMIRGHSIDKDSSDYIFHQSMLVSLR